MSEAPNAAEEPKKESPMNEEQPKAPAEESKAAADKAATPAEEPKAAIDNAGSAPSPAAEQPAPSNYQHQEVPKAIKDVSKLSDAAINEIQKVVVGQTATIELLLCSLFTGGHVLLEGVPGIAKTLLAKLMAKSLSADFSRMQFTPDLMPADVIGTTIFNLKNSEFEFNKGPIFSNIILIDEINRSPAKTQAALFEVMEERQISVDGTTYQMDFPFFVMATQNPIEQEGTYKLPEAQLDRFLFRLKLSYPDADDEKAILKRFKSDFQQKQLADVQSVFSSKQLQTCIAAIEEVFIKDELLDYIADIVSSTRNHSDLYLGASPRASLAIMKSSKALAAIRERNFVTPDDIKHVIPAVLNHRLILSPEREMEGIEIEEVIEELVKQIEVPR